jgi:hypothetical protein
MFTGTKTEYQSTPSQPSGISTPILRIAVLAAFIGSLASVMPANAQPADGAAEPPQNAIDQTAPVKHVQGHNDKKAHSPQAMAHNLEERIKTLHDKLGITSDQEAKWSVVAQTMRDNEAAIAALMESRRKNAEDMSAIDDLQSYEDITQAHADGIKKMIVSFQALYADMPDDQKKIADETFGSFEGRRRDKSAKKHK